MSDDAYTPDRHDRQAAESARYAEAMALTRKAHEAWDALEAAAAPPSTPPATVAAATPPVRPSTAPIPRAARPVPTEPPVRGGGASGSLVGLTASGAPLDRDSLMAEAARVWRQARGSHDGRFTIAHVEGQYPEAQRGDFDLGQHRALVAAGGICGPLETSYALWADHSTARPVRDALVPHQAERGGILYQSPAQLADIDTVPPDNAIGALTASDDAAGTTVKGVMCIPCQPTLTATVDAVYLRLCFSNFSDRYNPEHVESWMDAALAAHARLAEQRLLAAIDAGSEDVDAAPVVLSCWRDFIDVSTRLAAGIRNRERLRDDYPVTVICPSWLGDAFTVDLRWQAPGDSTEGVSKAQVITWAATTGIKLSFSPDTDLLAPQPEGPLTSWPDTATLRVFPSDGWLFLDGGTLDLGFVRDSATNAKNRFESFTETFENATHVWGESFTVEMPVCVAGKTSLPMAVACPAVVTP